MPAAKSSASTNKITPTARSGKKVTAPATCKESKLISAEEEEEEAGAADGPARGIVIQGGVGKTGRTFLPR
tara:strand:+ start:1208 stop:1420 length:213 start_codon:yes stop_codon:yes gene_type:complete